MVRLATELREAVISILQVSAPDNPALRLLIESYRDIARELGQQGDVERALGDLLLDPPLSPLYDDSPAPLHSSRSTSPSHTSWNAPPR